MTQDTNTIRLNNEDIITEEYWSLIIVDWIFIQKIIVYKWWIPIWLREEQYEIVSWALKKRK